MRRIGMTIYGAVAVAMVALACQEDLTAPGGCPAFCPTSRIVSIDSVLQDAFTADSQYVGYVFAHQATSMLLVDDSVARSWGVFRFYPSFDSLQTTQGYGPVASVDSFRLKLWVRGRTADTGLVLAFHRLPRSVDTAATFADLTPYFADTANTFTYPLPDTVYRDTVAFVFPGDSLASYFGDSVQVALGVELRASKPAFVKLGTNEGVQSANLERYVTVSVTDTTASGSDIRTPQLDTYVYRALAPAAPSVLRVGGTPSARAALYVSLPSDIIDSGSISRATLRLVPAEPVFGAPGDTMVFRADLLAADFGAKSPLGRSAADTLTITRLLAGSVDTVGIDVTWILRAWQGDPRLPHVLMIRITNEGGTLGELRFYSPASAVGAPWLDVTYIPIGAARGR